ncbi:MAG: hypothetical protein VE98_C0001G0448 [candidate division Kazan bacterium GW2011_GWA1_50_15]|uniref:Uncharacterized protein n=2 Tax=Bacteria division Kazan-3B-28 TaxID=1798534 RepID=A0A0G1X7J3_UNCK3|nr:MAG: hypothetical protein VE98_C0001G0448 [candidate division Kazan bacterium GW2011_GWA1_50_15]KKW27123.1 MAG: hypothetical protein VF00_C0001G0058 [candidate division Kazan bacterium GW2011_GWB1_52_7]HCR42411.1 hypothetical protein [Patescibacteria group bacterium]
MSNTVLRNTSKALAWLMATSMAVAFAAPQALAFENLGTFRYQWIAQSGTVEGPAHVVRANAGDTVNMSLTIRNRSTNPQALTMYGKSALLSEGPSYPNAHAVGIGTSHPRDNVPAWLDASSFAINGNRFAYYDGAAVNPGQDLTLTWTAKIASSAANGTYDLYTEVVREFDGWAQQVTAGGRAIASGDIFWRFIIGGGSAEPATGGLSVGISSGTPAASTVAYGGNANFTKITLTAAAGATVKVSQLYVTRDGLSADSDIENVKLVKADGVQVGNTAGGFNANHQAQIFITPALEITGSQDFYLRAGFISTGTTSGLTARLGIASNADIVSNATSVNGAPVYGNYMTTVAVTIGSLAMAQDGTISDSTPDVGDTNVITNAFKLTAGSTEPVLIERITVLKSGTTETADTNNIELWDVTHNVSLGTATSWSADGKASWAVNLTLGKGDSIRLRTQLDIVDGVGLTITTDAVDGSDVLVTGKGTSYGFYITPTATGSWNGLGGTQTINSGSLTISKSASTPPTSNITVADNQLLTVFDFDVRGESVRISAVHVDVTVTDFNGSTVVTYADLTNGRLVDMATGNILSGPVDGSADGTDPDEEFDFTNTFVLPVGISKVGFKVRLGTDFEASDTLVAAIDAAAQVTAKGIITNNSIVPGGTYGVTGNTQTVKAGALVLRDLGVPTTGNVVAGVQDFTWATMSLDATASGEDVLISAITVGDNVDATTGDMGDLYNAELWADLDNNGSYETKISSTEQPDGAAGTDDTQAFTLTQTIRVPKGGSVKIIFVADLSASATTGGQHAIGLFDDVVTGADVTATGADTGTAIAETDVTGAGTITVQANGSIAVAVGADTPEIGVVIANSNMNRMLQMRWSATDDAYTVNKVAFDLSAGYDSVKNLIVKYKNVDGVEESVTLAIGSQNDHVFQLNAGGRKGFWIPKNSYAFMDVYADTYPIGGGYPADFRDILDVSLSVDTSNDDEFEAIGLSTLDDDNLTVTGISANDQYLYKSKPTVTYVPVGTSTIANGSDNAIFSFSVTADAAGEIALKEITFGYDIIDNVGTNNTPYAGTFTFWRGSTDITGTVSVLNSGGTSIETGGSTLAEGSGTFHVVWDQAGTDSEESIGLGATKTYTVKATLAGFSTPADDDYIRVRVDGEAAAPTATYVYMTDIDDSAGLDVGLNVSTGEDATEEAAAFVWSDVSAINHLYTLADDTNGGTDVPASSADWTSGYLIKNLPTAYSQLTA